MTEGRARPHIYGFTLVELVVFIAILGIALAGVLAAYDFAVRASADPIVKKQALAIAESLLQEVQQMPFTYCDPDDPAVSTASSAASCATPETLGPEAGETRYSTATPFDNVNDYGSAISGNPGFSMNPIRDITNTIIAGLEPYTATVTITDLPGNTVIGLDMHHAFEGLFTAAEASAPRKTMRTGFTLVEMIAVIAITGILAAAVAVFLRLPLQSYQDAQRRASITDAADTAFGLLKRDLQSALPNSVRVTSTGAMFYLEFLQTRTAGRYRADAALPAAATSANTCPDTNGNGLADENVLQFGGVDACFTTLGPLANLNAIVPNGDFIAVYNLGGGFTGADAYASGNATGGNKSVITSAAAGSGGENVIAFQANTFDLESPGHRFHVISGPVSYVCDPATGTLRRFAGYAISAAQPTPPGGASVLLAQGITACTMTYDQNVINQRTGVVAIWLTFADPNATAVSLFQQVQVSNVP
jgi:MSHA biogenesis protein MshO